MELAVMSDLLAENNKNHFLMKMNKASFWFWDVSCL